MSNQPNIIELVKELQEQMKNPLFRNIVGQNRKIFDNEMYEKVYVLTQAILLAVEGLEEMQIGITGHDLEGELAQSKDVVDTALSQIRSLDVNG